MAQAMDVARTIIRKQRRVLAAAKHALNAIDPFDLTNNYRLEQGFTYELNLVGDGDQARDAFVSGERIVTR
jgi:enoyl-CoA hydratase